MPMIVYKQGPHFPLRLVAIVSQKVNASSRLSGKWNKRRSKHRAVCQPGSSRVNLINVSGH